LLLKEVVSFGCRPPSESLSALVIGAAIAIGALEASIAWLAISHRRRRGQFPPTPEKLAYTPSIELEVPGSAASDSDTPNGWWQAPSFYVLTLMDLHQPEADPGAFAIQEHDDTFVLAFRVCSRHWTYSIFDLWVIALAGTTF
jgi:hypothetical protein